MPLLKDLAKAEDKNKLDEEKVKEFCDGKLDPEKVDEGLKMLEDLAVVKKDKDPITGKKEIKLPEELEKPKLLPIIKDLLEDKPMKTVSEEEIEDACNDCISPEQIEDDLKELVDLGVLHEFTNPETGKKEYDLVNDGPKLLPIFKDLLKDKD